MPIYMDVHIVPGVTPRDVAEAHRMDIGVQEEYQCKCMTYWLDESKETIFCLIEAPEKGAVEQMHTHAHGLVPHKVIEVNSEVVQSFLGRIYDPADAPITTDNLKVFSDPSFRILLVTQINDAALLKHQLGDEKANELIKQYSNIIKTNIALHNGMLAEYAGENFIASFTNAAKAVTCALAIQKEMMALHAPELAFKIALNAGEPVEKSNNFFGDTIQLAAHLCNIAEPGQLAVAAAVKQLITKDYLIDKKDNHLILSPQDETFLLNLYSILETNWREAEFDVADFCREMAMSKSQLYRKTLLLTGFAPNVLLKEFRLQKAKNLMKKQCHSVAQISFECGFTSPSYFTKCFKEKYDLLPVAYLNLLH
jgi:AraC-like DNA-binding protein